MSTTIESVSDTAFLTAYYRALESDRADALFKDRHALDLAGRRGAAASHQIPGKESSASGCIVRTCIFDELILRVLHESKFDAVLNLGAGLDTRPFRLPLPSSIHWVEVDTPELLTYKQSKLAGCRPLCALQSVGLDVTDADARMRFLQRISERWQRLLIVTEGLLVYLDAPQVVSLANDLAAHWQHACWLTDLASPQALVLFQETFPDSYKQNAKLTFAPVEGPAFFNAYGWQAEEFYSCIEQGRRLKRWLLPEKLLATLSEEQWQAVRTLSGIVKMRRLNSNGMR